MQRDPRPARGTAGEPPKVEGEKGNHEPDSQAPESAPSCHTMTGSLGPNVRSDAPRQLFVVTPAYNEVASLAALCDRLRTLQRDRLPNYRVEVILVDDGSTDETPAEMRRLSATSSPHFSITGIQLARNFGQQAALHAGLEHVVSACGPHDFVALMDADLQHPVGALVDMVHELESGADHVQMLRRDADDTGWVRRSTSRLFYWLMRQLSGLALPQGGSDFRGLSQRFLAAYFRFRESGRFLRGLFYWMGFERRTIGYVADPRTYGRSKYGARRMLSLGALALFQFSSKPLVLVSTATVLLSLATCGAYVAVEFVRYLRGAEFVVGWPTLVVAIFFWGGVLAFNQLLLSLYLARVFEEVKERPIALVRTIIRHGEESSP